MQLGIRVAEATDSLVQNRKSSLCAAIERSRLGDCPLWTSNACERSLLLYPPTRNCDRSYRCSTEEAREALAIPQGIAICQQLILRYEDASCFQSTVPVLQLHNHC